MHLQQKIWDTADYDTLYIIFQLLEGVQKSEILVNSEELEDDLCDQKNVSDKVETDYKDTISSDKAETDCAAEPNEHSNLQPNSSQYLQPDNASQDCYYYNSEEDYYSYYAQFQQHQSYQQYMQEHHMQVINTLIYVRVHKNLL